jgi:hypothetical protein
MLRRSSSQNVWNSVLLPIILSFNPPSGTASLCLTGEKIYYTPTDGRITPTYHLSRNAMPVSGVFVTSTEV